MLTKREFLKLTSAGAAGGGVVLAVSKGGSIIQWLWNLADPLFEPKFKIGIWSEEQVERYTRQLQDPNYESSSSAEMNTIVPNNARGLILTEGAYMAVYSEVQRANTVVDIWALPKRLRQDAYLFEFPVFSPRYDHTVNFRFDCRNYTKRRASVRRDVHFLGNKQLLDRIAEDARKKLVRAPLGRDYPEQYHIWNEDFTVLHQVIGLEALVGNDKREMADIWKHRVKYHRDS